MGWKDWLYISKSDKIAISGLIVIIMILIAITTYLSFDKRDKESINLASNEPESYKAWKEQLTEQIEVEKQNYYKEYNKNYSYYYQPKMKSGETLELNSADTTLLKTIPGIGSGFAHRIANYRTALGGYARIEQLNEVWGLDTYLYEQMIPYITLEPNHDSLYINKDGFDKLLKHPYLNYKQVQVITDIRKRKGAIKSINRLKLLEEFTRRDIEKLMLYISFAE